MQIPESMSYNIHALPWDLAILLFLVGGMSLAVFSWKQAQGSVLAAQKRRFTALGIFGIFFTLVIFYGSFIEPQILTVTESELSLPMKADMKIVVLSDLHVGPYKGTRFVQRVVDKVNALNPDLVLLAGDFIYFGSDPLNHLVPLKDLHPRYGTFAVLGNHEYSCHSGGTVYRLLGEPGGDYSLPVRRALERSGVTVLRNDWREVVMDTGLLFIGGVDDSCTKREDLNRAMPEILKQSPLILIAHNPDIILEGQARRPHLIVAGHTHAGQIRLPFIGPIAPCPTQLGWDYDQGLFDIDANTKLAITRGVGESSPRARLFAPPEIMLLHAKGD